jgi:TPR repeat protein
MTSGDPEIVTGLPVVAEQGDVDAQYRVGLIYAEGRGMAQDKVKLLYWLSRVRQQGDTGHKHCCGLWQQR